MAQVRDLGLHERCHILAGVGPISSLRALESLEKRVPGVQVPAEVARRLRGVPEDRLADEGIAICAETISELRQIPGVAGVHVMAVGNEHRIPAILRGPGSAKPGAATAGGWPERMAPGGSGGSPRRGSSGTGHAG